VPYPPQVGELLPRFDEPAGIEYKLRTYSLAVDYDDGGPKAQGFLVMLGIGLASLDHLEHEIRTGIAHTPISFVRARKPDSIICTVQFRIAGPWPLQSANGVIEDGVGTDRPGRATANDRSLPARKGASMSATQTVIGEHDVVALLNPVGGWPAGTKGTVIIDEPALKFVEISNEFGEALTCLDVPPDQLRLVWKCPHPAP
jgi:hypothetical protein